MTARNDSRASVASVLGSLLLASCAGHVTPKSARPELETLSATMPELLRRVSNLAGRASSFTAEADLRFEDERTGSRRSVSLRLAGRKPADLRLQGTKALLPTIFVLVANADGIWLDVPTRHRTYVRPAGSAPGGAPGVGRALLALNPADFLRALVPDPPTNAETWLLVAEPLSYRLESVACGDEPARPLRTLVFDRTDLSLREARLYGEDGRLRSIVRLERDDDRSALPSRVRIERPFEHVAIELRIGKGRATTLDDEAFRFRTPPGRTVVDVSADRAETPEALPGLEEDGR